jgi:hypothetical protein
LNQQPHPRPSEARQVTQNGGGRLFPQGRSPRLYWRMEPSSASHICAFIAPWRRHGMQAYFLARNIRNESCQTVCIPPFTTTQPFYFLHLSSTRTLLACARLRPLWTVLSPPRQHSTPCIRGLRRCLAGILSLQPFQHCYSYKHPLPLPKTREEFSSCLVSYKFRSLLSQVPLTALAAWPGSK